MINITIGKKLLCFSIFFISCLGFSQNIQLIEPKNFENSNFEECIPCSEFENVKIIALGESSHRGSNTNIAKTKMVKYLHEKCGFNVLAFEACMYRMFENDQKLMTGYYKGDSLVRKVSGAWSSTEMKELYQYVAETQNSKKRLAFTGFDNMIPQPAHKDFTRGFKVFIDSLNKDSLNKIVLDDKFYEVLNRSIDKSYSYSKFPVQDTVLLHNSYKKIQNKIRNSKNGNDKYFSFWNKMINNLEGIYAHNNKRDLLMYDNLNFIMNEYYPNEKIIIWGATSHFLKKSDAVDHKYYKENDVMGDFLSKKYGDQYYVMAFSALEGKIGSKGALGLNKQKVVTKDGGIERYIHKSLNMPDYAFISFKQSINKKIILENVTNSSILGTHPTDMNLLEVVDGIFYLRTEGLVHWEF